MYKEAVKRTASLESTYTWARSFSKTTFLLIPSLVDHFIWTHSNTNPHLCWDFNPPVFRESIFSVSHLPLSSCQSSHQVPWNIYNLLFPSTSIQKREPEQLHLTFHLWPTQDTARPVTQEHVSPHSEPGRDRGSLSPLHFKDKTKPALYLPLSDMSKDHSKAHSHSLSLFLLLSLLHLLYSLVKYASLGQLNLLPVTPHTDK